jgi:predicted GNAT family acetyltransferase
MNKDDIILQLNEENRGGFYIDKDNIHIAEMVIAIKDNKLIVFHTEVEPELKGQNIGKLLLETMVEYARKNNLKVVPYCPFVRGQFKRHEKEYDDVWLREA